MMGEVMHVRPDTHCARHEHHSKRWLRLGTDAIRPKKKIYILRGDPAHQQKIYFDYNKARKGDIRGIVLQPGHHICPMTKTLNLLITSSHAGSP